MAYGASMQPGPVITLAKDSAATLSKYLRVKLDAQCELTLAGAGEPGIGYVDAGYNSTTDGDYAAVRLHSAGGEQIVVAAGAISAGALVYAAASGKVSATAFGAPLGVAKSAASGNNSEITIVPLSSPVTMGSYSVTIDGTAAALNSNNGRVDVVTGLAAAPSVVHVMVLTATTLLTKSAFKVDLTTTAGTIRVDGVAAGTQLDSGDIVHVLWIP